MQDAFTDDVIAEINKPGTDKTATKTTLRKTTAAIVPSPTATAVPAVKRAAAIMMPPGHKLVDPFTLFAEEKAAAFSSGAITSISTGRPACGLAAQIRSPSASPSRSCATSTNYTEVG